MGLDKDGDSLFSKYKKTTKEPAPQDPRPGAVAPGPAAGVPPAQAPVPAPAPSQPPVPDPKVAALQAEVSLLKAGLAGMKQLLETRLSVPPPPPPGPDPAVLNRLEGAQAGLAARLADFDKLLADMRQEALNGFERARLEVAPRLERDEKLIAELRQELAAQRDWVKAAMEGAAGKDELKKADFQVSYLAASFEGLKRAMAGENALSPRLERDEKLIAELRQELAAQRDWVKAAMDGVVGKEDLNKSDFRVSCLAASFDGLQKTFAGSHDLALRIERSEKGLGDLKAQLAGQQEKLNAGLAGMKQLLETRLSVPPPPPPGPDPAVLNRLEGAQAGLAARLADFDKLLADMRQEALNGFERARLEVAPRLERDEKLIAELRQELAAQRDWVKAAMEGAAGKDELKKADFQVSCLAASFEGLKRAMAGENALSPRLERDEKLIAELRQELAAQRDWVKAAMDGVVGKEDLNKSDFRVSCLAASFDGLREAFAGSHDLALRIERSEKGLGDLKAQLAGQQEKLRAGLGSMAPRQELEAVNYGFSEIKAAFTGLSGKFSGYAAEFSAIEHECRRSVGEVRGYLKNIDQKFISERFDEYLKDSVARLGSKLAEVETAMHTGLGDMSSRLMTNEVLYKKMFMEAEDRLHKALAPGLKSMGGSLQTLREKVIWLTDEYDIVMKRKIRALEGKYSAFDAIIKRMDGIDDELKKNEEGSGGRRQ